jgi:hypothetical protein
MQINDLFIKMQTVILPLAIRVQRRSVWEKNGL